MSDAEINRLFTAAAAAQQAGRPGVAAGHFQAVLAIRPEQPQALNSLGVQALAASQPLEARNLFVRAVASDPREPALWMNLAKAQRMLGDDAGERASLERVLAIDARHFMALIRKAELHERLDEDQDATRLWQGVLALAPAFEQPGDDFKTMLDHARGFVDTRMSRLAAALDQETADARRGLDRTQTRRFDAAVDHMLGRRPIYINDCAGLHFPFLPADEFFDRELFPWLPIVEAETPAIRAEVEALMTRGEGALAPYVSMDSGLPDNKWSKLDKSLDWSAYHLWRYGVRDDEACDRCPATAAIMDQLPLAALPGRAPSVFFSILRPRTRIPPHTGVSNTRAIIHLPLIVPDGCGFRVGGETRAWRPGEAFAFDDTIEHEAWNDSDEPRAVLIFDVWNPHLSPVEQTLLSRFYSAADQSGHKLGAS